MEGVYTNGVYTNGEEIIIVSKSMVFGAMYLIIAGDELYECYWIIDCMIDHTLNAHGFEYLGEL